MLLEKILDSKEMTISDLYDLRNAELINHEPMLLTDVIEWCMQLHRFKDKDIVIRGDYDPDGVFGDAILAASFDAMSIGKNVNVLHADPKRGYGLCKQDIDDILQNWPDTKLIVTNDNGIACKAAIDYAKENGISTIVSDHHPSNDLNKFPDSALAVVNINRSDKEEQYPFKGLSGASTSWKLMQAYAQMYHQNDKVINQMIDDLVMLAAVTVASDVMPLEDENKKIVNDGIELMNHFPQKCLQYTLLKSFPVYSSVMKAINQMVMMVGVNEVDYDSFGWVIGPLFNAERRQLASSEMVHLFFLNNALVDIDHLKAIKDEGTRLRNIEMKNLKNDIALSSNQDAIIVIISDAVKGHAGIIASQVVGKTNKPVIAVDNKGNGSSRSPKGYKLVEIYQNIQQNHPEWIGNFGGHDNAAGIQFNMDYFDEFEEEFCKLSLEQLKNIDESDLEEETNAIKVDESDLTIEEYGKVLVETQSINHADKYLLLSQLEFETVINLDNYAFQFMGKDKSHVKLKPDGKEQCSFIIWSYENFGDFLDHEKIKVIGKLSVNSYKGNRSLQMIVDNLEVVDE